MPDSSGASLVPPRDSRLTPESIIERGFSQVKRGYSESEVRAYLRMVADEFATLAGRERDLANRVRSLEERLSAPTPAPSDQDLITALGVETARVLGQARDSALELRNKAEEHARRVVREAQESARELRTSTQQAMEAKTREAEDAARAHAKEIVGEARAMRERVLADLNERRQELERQVADLRAGRGRLVETYQLVERALVQATRVMADEPASPPAPPAPGPTPGPAPSVPDTSVAAATTATESAETAPAAVEPPAVEEPAGEEPAVSTAAPADVDSDTRDVGALFEKLRSEQSVPETVEPVSAAPLVAADTAAAEAAAPEMQAEPTEPEPPEPEPGAPEPEMASDPDRALLAARDDLLAPIAEDLSRRAKRALQDEQNDVLDGLRRQRGKIDTTKILPPADDQLARWAHVLQPSVDRAYAAGVGSDGTPPAVPAALLAELAEAAVTPLRGRLESALDTIDTRSPADIEIAVAQRLGARYREWRAQDLDVVLGDALAVAYSRGVYDGAPEAAQLRWIPAREGKCADCDDNALEPTVRGAEFPTGQPYPPAHPGCRCLLSVTAP